MNVGEVRKMMKNSTSKHEFSNLYIKKIDDYILNAASNKSDCLNFGFPADSLSDRIIKEVSEHYKENGFEVSSHIVIMISSKINCLTISWKRIQNDSRRS